MSSKSPKPLGFSQTTGVAKAAIRRAEKPLGLVPVGTLKGLPGRPRRVPEKLLRPLAIAEELDDEPAGAALPSAATGRSEAKLEPLVREWLLDLQVLGRSPKTIDWYRKHIRGRTASFRPTPAAPPVRTIRFTSPSTSPAG